MIVPAMAWLLFLEAVQIYRYNWKNYVTDTWNVIMAI
jgi:hypothetical protein